MKYEKPNMEVIEIEVKDVICASLGNGGKGDNENTTWIPV